MTDNFVMVIPEGWTEIENATQMIEAWGENGVISTIQQQAWGEIDSMLEAAGILPAGKTTAEARLFSAGETGDARLRLWVIYQDIPA
jgi:hypothetical protein